MKKKLSLFVAFVVMVIISIFAFNAYAEQIDISEANLKLGYSTCGYDGAQKTPNTTVVLNSEELERDKDYSVTYKNNVDVGYATCIVNGIGEYTGSISKTYKILSSSVTGLRLKSADSDSITLQWNKASNISGYQIFRYFPSMDKYEYVRRVAPNQTTYTVNDLPSGLNYWFIVRSYKYINSTDIIYGIDSDFARVSTCPKQISLYGISKMGSIMGVRWYRTNCSGYQIFYALKSDFSDAKCITINDPDEYYWKIYGLRSDKNYYVKVRAFRDNNGVTYKGYCSRPGGSYYYNLYTTYYSRYPDNYNRTTNLMIASKAITDTIVYPGETFDFNDVVGPRTTAKGYREAPIFTGGSGVANGVGGGICQVASTMFNCVLYGNMGIVERHQHSQRVSYVPLGRDAAIYGTVENFRWKNTTDYPIQVVMSVGSNVIRCSLYMPVMMPEPDVELSVSRSGNRFTMTRYVNGYRNYSCTSTY